MADLRRGADLPFELLDTLQDGLGENLADVRVCVRPGRAEAALERVEVPLWVAASPLAPMSRLVLAHEFAHIAQFRRGRAGGSHAPEYLLEQEVACASLAVLAGRSYRCIKPAGTCHTLAWGVAGHYYTVYFILLAAGVDPVVAKQLAFFAQMPDQVDELDATSAGKDLILRGIGGDDFPTAQDIAASLGDVQVQKGLHALTGGDAEMETTGRAKRLRSATLGSFEFGLALHAYGDSYAHRRIDHPAKMYSAALGHAVEYLHFNDAHSPDFCNRRSLLFKRYGCELFEIVRSIAGWGGARLDTNTVGAAMDSITSVVGDSAQIATVRAMTFSALQQKLDPYRPESEKLAPWAEFRRAHSELKDTLLAEALGYAARWA